MIKPACFFLFLFFFQAVFITALSAQIRYSVNPDNPRPGEPVTIGVYGEVSHAVLTIGERQFSRTAFFPVPGFMAAVLTVPSAANSGAAVIKLENNQSVIYEIPITIADRTFRSEVIDLNPTLTGIRTDPSPQRVEEANLLWAILRTTGDTVYHTGSFVPPVTSTRRTSFFGNRRVFRYSDGRSDTSIHAGVDYGVPTGTRVIASGAGRVVLARSRIVTGNSIIIEHAPGIYSLYYHLDKIEVEEGSIVNTGALLGLSGATGLATGPHLHWEIRVNTENTDPDAFLNRPILDKELIMSKISN